MAQEVINAYQLRGGLLIPPDCKSREGCYYPVNPHWEERGGQGSGLSVPQAGRRAGASQGMLSPMAGRTCWGWPPPPQARCCQATRAGTSLFLQTPTTLLCRCLVLLGARAPGEKEQLPRWSLGSRQAPGSRANCSVPRLLLSPGCEGHSGLARLAAQRDLYQEVTSPGGCGASDAPT